LEGLERPKMNDTKLSGQTHKRSLSQASRFLAAFETQKEDRGVKKFPEKLTHFKNISQLIESKSETPKAPQMSIYRRVECSKTK